MPTGHAGDVVRWPWYPLGALETHRDFPSSRPSSKAGLIGERVVGDGCWGLQSTMSQSQCPSTIRTHSCVNLLLPSPRLMAFRGAAPKSHNDGGEWVGADHGKATFTLFPLIPVPRIDKWVQMGHRGPLLFGAASSWHGLGKGPRGGDLMHVILAGVSSWKQPDSIFSTSLQCRERFTLRL